jgi:hypothetical protein
MCTKLLAACSRPLRTCALAPSISGLVMLRVHAAGGSGRRFGNGPKTSALALVEERGDDAVSAAFSA